MDRALSPLWLLGVSSRVVGHSAVHTDSLRTSNGLVVGRHVVVDHTPLAVGCCPNPHYRDDSENSDRIDQNREVRSMGTHFNAALCDERDRRSFSDGC